MSDWVSDASSALYAPGVAEYKRLKCCGHTIPTVDEGIGYVLKEAEVIIGKYKLVNSEEGLKHSTVKTALQCRD